MRRERPYREILARLAVPVDEVTQDTDAPAALELTVGIGERHDASVIAELHVDEALVAEPVIGLVPGQPDGSNIDQHVR